MSQNSCFYSIQPVLDNKNTNFKTGQSPDIHILNVYLAETTCLKSLSYRQTFQGKPTISVCYWKKCFSFPITCLTISSLLRTELQPTGKTQFSLQNQQIKILVHWKNARFSHFPVQGNNRKQMLIYSLSFSWMFQRIRTQINSLYELHNRDEA